MGMMSSFLMVYFRWHKHIQERNGRETKNLIHFPFHLIFLYSDAPVFKLYELFPSILFFSLSQSVLRERKKCIVYYILAVRVYVSSDELFSEIKTYEDI